MTVLIVMLPVFSAGFQTHLSATCA